MRPNSIFLFGTEKNKVAGVPVVVGGHALLLPLKCIEEGGVVVTRLAKDVPVGEQSEYTTHRKKKLP
jgi:hypothetical protein